MLGILSKLTNGISSFLEKSNSFEISAICGACFVASSNNVDALNIKIPLFQKYVPADKYFFAVSRLGFSTNSFTLNPSPRLPSVLMYP